MHCCNIRRNTCITCFLSKKNLQLTHCASTFFKQTRQKKIFFFSFSFVNKKIYFIFARTMGIPTYRSINLKNHKTMEIKKNARADIEKSKPLSFLMGIVVGLATLFVGFEWGERDIKITVDSGIAVVIQEEEIEATVQEEYTPPPPAVEPEVIKAPEIIQIVEDNVKVEEVSIMTSEGNADQVQEATYVPPAAIVVEEEEVDEHHVFYHAEQMPEYPGGHGAMMDFLNKNMKYPDIPRENGIAGTVSCQFTVNVDGTVTDVEVLRGVDPYLDKEAMRVIKLLSKFKPGEQRGKPVRVKYNARIKFQLN